MVRDEPEIETREKAAKVVHKVIAFKHQGQQEIEETCDNGNPHKYLFSLFLELTSKASQYALGDVIVRIVYLPIRYCDRVHAWELID